MFKSIKEFAADAGGWGLTSITAAATLFAISIWEHAHDKPLSSLLFICLTVPLFWTGSWIAWAKKKRDLEDEKFLHGGPEISLSWGAVPPTNTRKALFLENTGPIDAYEIKVGDIGMNKDHCHASFPAVPKCPKGTHSALSFVLRGDGVPQHERGNLEMIVYAAQGDFPQDEQGNPVVDMPINVTFEEYGGAKYETAFRLVADPYLSKVNLHRISRGRIT